MAYNHKTQFPRSYVQIVNVTTTPQTLFAASAAVGLKFLVISNGDATPAVRTVIFRAVDDSPEVLRMCIPASTSIVVPGWKIDTEGLEVLDAASNTAGVYVTAFYVQH